MLSCASNESGGGLPKSTTLRDEIAFTYCRRSWSAAVLCRFLVGTLLHGSSAHHLAWDRLPRNRMPNAANREPLRVLPPGNGRSISDRSLCPEQRRGGHRSGSWLWTNCPTERYAQRLRDG